MKILRLLSILPALGIFLIQSCEDPVEPAVPCPEPFMVVSEGENFNEITAVAEFPGFEEITYSWYVNDTLVETEEVGSNNRDDIFNYAFDAAGTYTICVRVDNAECGQEVEYCEEVIIVQPDCPAPSFQFADGNSPDQIVAIADFPGMEAESYIWSIDGATIEREVPGIAERDDMLDHIVAESGTYTVCITMVDPDCGEQVQYCDEIEISIPTCPNLSFTATEDPQNVYLFQANFQDKENTQYVWVIGIDTVDYENYPGNDTDHELFWQFGPFAKDVCIVATNADDYCQEIKYCQTVTPVVSEGCPDMSFSQVRNEGNTYTFEADFTGIDNLPWYGWYVNGVEKEAEGTDNNGDNFFTYTFDGPGSYEVCILTETPECNSGTGYCLILTID